MTLRDYLKHQTRWEIAAIGLVFFLVVITNATSDIIENYREGLPLDVSGAFLLEITSNVSVIILIPLIVLFINRLNLSYVNFRWRVLWHVPAFLLFMVAHVSMMVLFRKMIWAVGGDSYNYGPVAISLLYESRKDLLTYLSIVVIFYGYDFILSRLQGEAKFLADREGADGRQVQQDEECSGDFDRKENQGEARHRRGVSYKHQFLVKMLNTEYLVKVDEIESVNSASNYVLLNCGDRSYPMRQTMTGLLEQLDPLKFVRVHRTAIVNLRRIQSVSESDLQVTLLSGAVVPVSKTYLPELRQALSANSG